MIVTRDRVVEVTKQVVAEHGMEHVYEKPMVNRLGGEMAMCLYVHNGRPSCLVGHVLHRLGVPLDVLAQGDDQSQDASSMCYEVLYNTDFADEMIASFLSTVQATQDAGYTWGYALESGLKLLAEI